MGMDSVTLRFAKLWLSIGWSLIAIIVVLSLMPPGPITIDIRYSDKFEHILAYFVLMGWFAQIYHAPATRWRMMARFILLGIALEIIQGAGGVRTSDWTDVIANSIGVVLAWHLTKNQFSQLLTVLERKFLTNGTYDDNY